MNSPLSRTVTAEEADAGERLDRLLSRRFDDVSRARIQRLILNGSVQVDGRTIVEPSFRVKPASEIRISLPQPSDPKPHGEAISLSIVYEDPHLIVIDKPAGLVVHPAPGHHSGTLVNALIAHCGDSLSGIGGVRRPGIVHRLDKDTSGLMIVARNERAHRALSAAVKHREVVREYTALVEGRLGSRTGTIDAPLGRHRRQRTKRAVKGTGSRVARTHFEVIEPLPADTLVHAFLETGRTHQIRVHFAAIGHPVVGDPEYGASGRHGLERQFLHAYRLEFTHPRTEKRLEFTSELPADLRGALGRARLAG
jgi:23S rRNA pseudouridine1911/1915/1917 synthase